MPAKFKQGDLIYLIDPVKLPKGEPLQHPVLIISSNVSNSYENFYTAVMMSATEYTDRFSFKCDNGMFESNLEKPGCNFRTYITISFKESEIKHFKNRIKPVFLRALLEHIKLYTFCID